MIFKFCRWWLGAAVSVGLTLVLVNQVGARGEDGDRAIRLLDDTDFATRMNAHLVLLSWAKEQPEEAMAKLARAFFATESEEVRFRLSTIMARVYLGAEKPLLGFSFKEEVVRLEEGLEVEAMRVAKVSAGKAAHQAGLQVGDKVVAIGSELAAGRGKSADGERYVVKAAIDGLPIGEKVPFTILRDGKQLVLMVRIEVAPRSEEDRLKRLRAYKKWLQEQGTGGT